MGLAARAVLVPAAALAVHQLRYMLAYGTAAGAELTDTGHSYLHSLVPWIVLLMGISAGAFVWALGRALAGKRTPSRRSVSFAALWLACTVCLVAIYGTQEFLEGLFATGHPAGPAGIFGYGGWWAIPAAGGVACVLAAMFAGARWALDEVARRAYPVGLHTRRAEPVLFSAQTFGPRLRSLADGWSGRGPPR